MSETRDGERRPLRYVEAGMFVFLCIVALTNYRQLFEGWTDFVVPAIGGTILGGLAAVVAFRNGVHRLTSAGAAVVLGALFVIYAVLIDTLVASIFPGADTWRALSDGVFSGFSRALSDSVPLREPTPLVVWLSALSWVAGFCAADTSIRNRLVALPAVPGIALFALALPLTAPVGGPSNLKIVVFVAAVLLAILLRASPTFSGAATDAVELHSRATLASRMVVGVPLIVLLTALGPTIASLIGRDDAFDPRDLREEVVSPNALIDPLAEYRVVVSRVPAQSLFRIVLTGSTPTEVGRLPALTLDQYDGVRWYSTARFVTGGAGRNTEGEVLAGPEVSAQIFVEQLPNQFLPTIGGLTDLSLGTAAINADSGDAFSPTPIAGTSYVVRGRLVQPQPSVLSAAGIAGDREAAAASRLVGAPPRITELAATITRGQTGAAAIAAIDNYVRSNHNVDDRAPSGSSFGALETFLFDTRAGTPEQFAAAFAVLARAAGYPTRVVLGYRTVEDRGGAPVGINDITTANYHVWAEVKYAGLGWVAFDPTPRSGEVRAPIELPGNTGQGSGGIEGGVGGKPREAGPRETAEAQESESGGYRGVLARLGAGLVILAAAITTVALLLVATKRARRLRRRHANRRADQVSGAWDEVLDRLCEVGMAVPASMTHREVVEAASARFGPDTVLPMRAMVHDLTTTVYGYAEPSEAMADHAWKMAKEMEENLASSVGTARSLMAKFSLQPFLRDKDNDEELLERV